MRAFKQLGLMLLLLIIKTGYFYSATDMPLTKILYILVTVSVFMLLYVLLGQKAKLYSFSNMLITVMMYADILYFRYFNDFLSVKLLHQATFVGSVSSIVFSFIKLVDLVLFIDLIVYFILHKNNRLVQLSKRKILFILLILILPSIALGISYGNKYTGIKRYEFFNYHMHDLLSVDTDNSTLWSKDRSEILERELEQKRLSGTGELYGIAKDKHLILIQMESVQNDFIGKFYKGQEITPTLNQLVSKDSIYFTNYYQQLGKGNTSDAEFVSLNSLYAITTGNTYNVYEKNSFYGLPWILREHGYESTSYHGYVSSFWNRENIYPAIGFQKSYFESDYVLGEKVGFGLDDIDFFPQTIEKMKTSTADKRFDFIVTLTCHKPYTIPEKLQEITVDPEDENFFGDYLNSLHYFDYALSQFIEDLKAEGLYEDTIIVLYGDHYGIGIEHEDAIDSISRFNQRPYTLEDMFNIPLIIHIPGSNLNRVSDRTGGQIDLVPTLLNLMGIHDDVVTFGQDLLNTDHGFVASQTFMEPGSFITQDIVYEASRDGQFENGRAYHRDTHEPLSIETLEPLYQKALRDISLSKRLTESNTLLELIHELRYGHSNTLRE